MIEAAGTCARCKRPVVYVEGDRGHPILDGICMAALGGSDIYYHLGCWAREAERLLVFADTTSHADKAIASAIRALRESGG